MSSRKALVRVLCVCVDKGDGAALLESTMTSPCVTMCMLKGERAAPHASGTTLLLGSGRLPM
jgi:hypothetical protein